MNAAVDILAAGVVVQSLGFTGAALIFGMGIRKQLRIAPPAKEPETPKQEDAGQVTPPASLPDTKVRPAA